jgi:hypothetical protein
MKFSQNRVVGISCYTESPSKAGNKRILRPLPRSTVAFRNAAKVHRLTGGGAPRGVSALPTLITSLPKPPFLCHLRKLRILHVALKRSRHANNWQTLAPGKFIIQYRNSEPYERWVNFRKCHPRNL